MSGPRRVAFFVTPHGFGHAARAAAVMAALRERAPEIEIEVWTTVPRWFFEESLAFPFFYRDFSCDVGLVQRSPVEEDLSGTVAALERFWTVETRKAHTREVGSALVASGTDLVLADISPFGLEVARAVGLPSVLLENFTWDWIYEPLVAQEPGFAPWVPFLRERFALADLHLQLEPTCAPATGAFAVPPIARRTKGGVAETRARLAIPADDALVLVSLGGIAHRLTSSESLFSVRGATFALLGASEREARAKNLRLLPHHSPIYHPDLVAAADLVVGKLGYSTVAEAVAAGTRMLYVPRTGFRESAILERYVEARLPAASLTMAELESGAWAARVPEILATSRPAPTPATGAEAVADAIVRRFDLG